MASLPTCWADPWLMFICDYPGDPEPEVVALPSKEEAQDRVRSARGWSEPLGRDRGLQDFTDSLRRAGGAAAGLAARAEAGPDVVVPSGLSYEIYPAADDSAVDSWIRQRLASTDPERLGMIGLGLCPGLAQRLRSAGVRDD